MAKITKEGGFQRQGEYPKHESFDAVRSRGTPFLENIRLWIDDIRQLLGPVLEPRDLVYAVVHENSLFSEAETLAVPTGRCSLHTQHPGTKDTTNRAGAPWDVCTFETARAPRIRMLWWFSWPQASWFKASGFQDVQAISWKGPSKENRCLLGRQQRQGVSKCCSINSWTWQAQFFAISLPDYILWLTQLLVEKRSI